MSGKAVQSWNLSGLSAQQVQCCSGNTGKMFFTTNLHGGYSYCMWHSQWAGVFPFCNCLLYLFYSRRNKWRHHDGSSDDYCRCHFFYQEVKSTNEIQILKQFTGPNVKVVQDVTKKNGVLSLNLVKPVFPISPPCLLMLSIIVDSTNIFSAGGEI